MIEHLRLGGIVMTGAVVLLAAQPAFSAPTQVTSVEVRPTSSGVDLVLQTQIGDRPQIFTVNRGNALTADIINTQLRLPEGNSFQQENPAPGIASISVVPLDANSIRITVSGTDTAPAGQVSQRGNEGITLSFNPAGDTAAQPAPSPAQAGAPAGTASAPPAPSPQAPVAQAPVTQAPGQSPDVLVPNPEITIDGAPASPGDPGFVPPFLPRAIAPPVGDIAISNIDTSPTAIDLGTAERVPRLVLRDAPVREVLSLLARAAGLNLAYTGGSAASADPAAPAQAPGTSEDITISLDIENEPVQDVFNYVLRISNLEANRVGRTIFAGPRLPDDARSVAARTLRLNQVNASDAANFLTAQGAETQLPIERVEIQTIGEGAASRTVEIRTPEILALRATEGNGPLLLRGLSVSTNERLNTITLVGTPRKVEVASALLTQLDLRRRQVAVNVKIIDVNLLNTEDFNTSFSFGIGDSFFSTDGGAASFNYGGVRPPTQGELAQSLSSPPVTRAIFPETPEGFEEIDLEPFQDPNSRLTIPDAIPGTVLIDPSGNVTRIEERQPGSFLNPGAPVGPNGQVFGAGITEFTAATDNIITQTRDAQGNITTAVTQGTPATIDVSLPSLFQFPSRFLSALQAQVVSGNAKILTDPTLTVQEGQRAIVNLTQEVYGGLRGTGVGQFEPIIRDAGLILDVLVTRIDDNGFVTLAVSPTVSVPGASVSAPGQQGQITLLQERSLQSGEIRLRDGQTLILSGIIQDSDRTTVSKVPILGDIPILGALFRSTNRQNSRQEVIVLLTPQILDDSDLSPYGYSYRPGREVQQILQRQGAVPVQSAPNQSPNR